MDWLLVPPSSLLVVLLLVLLLLTTILLLLRAVGVGPGNPVLSRATFECPVSGQLVTVEFLVPPGSDIPADVLSCSVFSKPYHVRCKKGCLTKPEPGGPATQPRYPVGEFDPAVADVRGASSSVDSASREHASQVSSSVET